MKGFKKTKNLSDNVGTALIECVEDLEACELHPDYEVDMLAWHRPNFWWHDGIVVPICAVCLGGSNLARRADNPDADDSYIKDSLPEKEVNKVQSMDLFRIYNIGQGTEKFYSGIINRKFIYKCGVDDILSNLNGDFPDRLAYYNNDPDTFKNNMILIGLVLEEMCIKHKWIEKAKEAGWVKKT